ncbi:MULTISPECIES: TniQ family protein [Rhodobacterales]|uniref:TniQ family protein n=1 Tax=Rhodobacterales TaxID=204455 RepID=UPI00215D87C0|nr:MULTISPECIES: TniQ family protein [Rhodobacterales]MDO6591765.1 TniQ family protein [Yoonia sp. 1_MG-2023]
MTARLIPTLPLFEGEALTGYVSRHAKLFETTPRDFCTDLGMRWPALCSGYDEQIGRLAWLTGESSEKLRSWSVKKVGNGRYRVGQAHASMGTLRRTAVRLCPQCVARSLSKAGPAGVCQLLEWSLVCIDRCAEHGCRFITLPSAENSHATYDFVARVLAHHYEVFQAADRSVQVPEIGFETYVRERLRNGAADDWLQNLDLTQLHRASVSLGAALCDVKVKRMQDLPKTRIRELCQAGFQSLVEGPQAYRKALSSLYDSGNAERPYYSADFGVHFRWLREVRNAPEIEVLASIAREHVFARYPTQPGKKVFDRLPPGQVWLTIDQARKRLGFGAVFLKKLLGHLDGVAENQALKRTDVHVDEIPKVLTYWDGLINLKDAAGLLGLMTAQVKGLQDRGVLKTIRITSTLRYLSRVEVMDLIEQVERLPELLLGKSVAPLNVFCREKGIPLSEVVDLWRKGDLEGQICRGGGVGLNAIEVDWDAICPRKTVRLHQDITLPETARYLKINVAAIRHLRDQGILSEVRKRNPDTNHQKQYISKGSIQAFERSYVTLGQLAEVQKVAPIHLARKLDVEGIEPIPCAGALVRVYSKREFGLDGSQVRKGGEV